jgi:hypothetical protein
VNGKFSRRVYSLYVEEYNLKSLMYLYIYSYRSIFMIYFKGTISTSDGITPSCVMPITQLILSVMKEALVAY